MATYTSSKIQNGATFNGKWYQKNEIWCSVDYSVTTYSDNSQAITLNSATIYYEGWTNDPSAKPDFCTDCCGRWGIYWSSELGGNSVMTWNFGNPLSIPLGSKSWPKSINKTYYVSPGGRMSVSIFRFGTDTGCGWSSRKFSYSNPLSRPTPTPPSLSPSCHASTANGNTIIFNGGGSWGYCESQSNSSSYAIYDSDSMTTPIKSGSGYSATVSGLSPNTRYWASFRKSNGCYARSATCTAVTVTPNSLSEPSPRGWDKATVRLAVTNGGGEYDPNTAIYIKNCSVGSWSRVATSTTKAVEVINLSGLEAETCYQVQARTTTPAGTYTGNTVKFTTLKKGLCVAEFTKIEPGMDEKTYEATADICYKWETTKVPATIVVHYQVKDGYDKTWYESEELVTNEYSGTYCLTLRDLYPNQTVYQTYIHTETDETTYDSPMSEFITVVIPEPDIHNCDNFTYLSELLCQSVKKLLDGNKTVYANPASQVLCDPYNEDPTLLTLWSRALRLFHAMYCLVCDMRGSRLTTSKPGQYLVGETGWQDIIKIIDENADDGNWKIATSDAIYNYINDKLHQVWHYHGAVDILVYSLEDLEKFPDATSAVVVAENAIYRKADDEWEKSTAEADKIDDMGVWHINTESSTHSDERTYYAQAGSAWYAWQGNWQPLDADVTAYTKIVDAMWEKRDQVIYNETGSDHLHVRVQDRLEFTCDTPNDERWVTFITEPLEVMPPEYHLIRFETGQDATVIQDQEVLDGALAQQPNPPEKPGMRFVEWQDRNNLGIPFDWSQPIYTDYTLDAIWQTRQLSVTFILGNGEANVVKVIESGETVEPPADPTRADYIFTGWFTDSGFTTPWDDTIPIHANTTVYAGWSRVWTVTFDSDGGDSTPEAQIVIDGELANTPQEPTKDGCTFGGWYDASGDEPECQTEGGE